jgi:hypothetical protein
MGTIATEDCDGIPNHSTISTSFVASFLIFDISLFPIPYSLFPIPYSLFPIPYSLSPIPYSLAYVACENTYRGEWI